MKPFAEISLLSLCIGAIIGSFATYSASHRSAVRFETEALNRVPHGQLVATSKIVPITSVSLTLSQSYGSNPGYPFRYHSGNITSHPFGSISFSYPTTTVPKYGDIIIIHLEAFGGGNHYFIVSNGSFGKVFENDVFVLNYVPNNAVTKQRA